MSLNNQKLNVTYGLESDLPDTYDVGTLRVCTDTKNVYLDLDSERIRLSANADTANTLSTARTIRTNLASASASSFNGSSNITPGVTGTLPIANGGTGATSASAARTALGAAASSHTHTAAQVTGLTASRALVSDASGHPAVSAVTSTELGYLDGVTSAIQTQLNGKQATITGGASTITNANLTASRALVSDGNGKVAASTVTSTELGYLDGVTSAIQKQLDGKATSSHTHSLASTTAAGFLRKLNGSTSNFLRGDGTWATPPNTTYSNMTGATSSAAGKAGLVPAPSAGAATRYLRSDGTWSVPPDTNTTYTLSSFGITATAAELNRLDGITATTTELNYVDGVTSNIQTQLNNKAPSSHTHKYAGSSSAGGSANSAVKLATARTIGLGTGVTGTATNFDGSANITIPVTSVKEAYLSWGGKNFAGSFGPLDASLVSELGANRFAFGKPAGITIEYSTDAGKTWLDYGASDAAKVNLLTTSTTLTVGKATTSNKATANSMLRVTLKMNSLGLYTALNKFAINVSTNGSNGCYCTIDASTHKTPTTFTTIANKIPLSGWSGWNIINPTSYTYGGNMETYYGILRFTFGISSNTSVNYAGLQVMSIYGYGGMGWTLPSNMAYNGHIYRYDSGQNATFPAAINAKSFSGPLTGNATTASTLQTARTINGTSFNGSANITTANWGTARTITIGNSGKSVNGSKNVSWSLSEIGAAASSHNHSAANITSGTLAIARGGTGATTASAARTNLGIIVSSTAPSDTTAIWIKPAT